MRIDRKRVKKITNFGKKVGFRVKIGASRVSTRLKEYEKAAPKRRKEELSKIKYEIQKEKMQQQLRRLKEKNRAEDFLKF